MDTHVSLKDLFFNN